MRKHFFITSKRIIYHNQPIIIVIIDDNTDLQNQQDKLKRLYEEKNRILGVVAHDLRNPMGVISGYSDFLLEMSEKLPMDEKMAILQVIKDASMFSLDMLEELLDLSAIESGKLQLHFRNQNYRDLVHKVIRINQVWAHKKNILIDFVCDLEEVIITFDKQKIEQVLNNLLSNAIKYSQFDTRIVVTIEKKAENIITQVKDQGQGIPAADIHSIFYPFEKADVQPTAGEKSTGLGLAIAKRIVEEHHGILSVESVLNEGSTFSFTLPLEMTAGNLSENV